MPTSPNPFSEFHQLIQATLQKLAAQKNIKAELSNFQVEKPKNPEWGDLSTNAAMVLAKSFQMSPTNLAKSITTELTNTDWLESVTIAGVGFINVTLKQHYWQKLLPQIHDMGKNFGRVNVGLGKKISVEFVSVNPTGPLHVGHARGAIFGDALQRLLKFAGYQVTAEYYINDAGAQIDSLAQSLYFRYQQRAGKIPETAELPKNCYPAEYLKDAAEKLYQAEPTKYLTLSEAEWLPLLRKKSVDMMMAEIKQDLASLKIQHDIFVSEAELVAKGLVQKVLNELEKLGKIYTGVLEKPKGKQLDDWEPRAQKLFRSTDYGDDIDRPIQKSDGSWTYFANDIAYHLDKYQRGHNKMVNILGADHAGYVKRITAAVQAVSQNQAELHCLTMQIVRFMDKGQALKMSKRAGNFVMLRDVVARVGAGALRLYILSRRPDSQMDFDYAEVTAAKKDNPVFYLHYAFARTYSAEQHIKAAMPEVKPNVEYHGLLQHPQEIKLIKQLAELPRVVEQSATLDEPHRIVFYLLELAAAFHQLWTLGRDDKALKFLQQDNEPLTSARYALLLVVRQVMAIASGIVGIELEKKL